MYENLVLIIKTKLIYGIYVFVFLHYLPKTTRGTESNYDPGFLPPDHAHTVPHCDTYVHACLPEPCQCDSAVTALGLARLSSCGHVCDNDLRFFSLTGVIELYVNFLTRIIF